jgi:[acyl-carrier-protein] S-malonyltransferase
MKTAFVFPGQGAQYPGMGKDLWETSSAVKRIFELASETTGINLTKLIFEGTEDELKATDKQQVAITVVNLSAAAVLKEHGVRPDVVAGFSLGEFAALHEAGVVSLKDAVRIVRARGEIFERVSRSLDSPTGSPGMAAVVGLDFDKLSAALKGIEGVYAANHNSPTQIAISGTAKGLDAAEAALKAAGARRIIRLKVSGPFHSPLLDEARNAFGAFLETIEFSEPKVPIYQNVTGKRTGSAVEAKKLSVEQVVSTVRWVDLERNLLADGVERFIEVGPGAVLAGFLKAVCEDKPCLAAGKIEQINQIIGG